MNNKGASASSLRRVLAILILVSVVLLAIVLFRHLAHQAPEEILEALPKQVDLSLEKLHYTQNEDGQRSWTLTADQAEYQRDSGEALLENVQLVFYQAGQFGEVTLTAGQGRLNQEQQRVDLWEQVEIRTARREQLFTERLVYDGQQQVISGAEPFRLLSPQMELTGKGLSIELDKGRLLVKEDVWMLLLPAEKGGKTDE